VKSDIRIPLLYGLIVGILLTARIKPVRKAISRFHQNNFIKRLKPTKRFLLNKSKGIDSGSGAGSTPNAAA
jgi:hypothetical protein